MTRACSNVTVGAIAALIACCAVFAFLLFHGAPRTALMIPVTIAWMMALLSSRPIVERNRHTALYFAFAVLALMIFFIHETYGYTGQVRNFPLIVGYTGVVLSLLDILSLTDTRAGATVSRFFGSTIDTAEMETRSLNREVAAFAAMCGCVLGIWLFGFLVFSPFFVTGWMLIGGKSLKQAVYGGVFTITFVWLMFEVAFQYELFRGILFLWLFDL